MATNSANEAIIDFANAMEAACVKLRMLLGDKPAAGNGKDRTWKWDPTRVKWENRTGTKGPYQFCKEPNNVDYQNMVADLKEHNFTRDGQFYWLFGENDGVGRKEVVKQ